MTETCKRGIHHAKLCLDSEELQEASERRQTVVRYTLEFHEMLFHQFAVMKDFESLLDTSTSHSQVSRAYCGDMSTEYASALYYEAKALYSSELTRGKAFDTLQKSLHIWK